MAITWELQITPISLLTKEASIKAIRVDDVDGSTMSYDVPLTVIDANTMANNIHILDDIWEQHQARLAKNTTINNFVSNLEAAGKTNLEARE